MKKKTVSGIILTMLLMALTLAFNLQALWAETVSEEFAVVYVDPSVSVANKPEVFTISINIDNVTDLWGWGLELRWKQGLLWCEYTDEGPFLSMNGTQDTWWFPIIDNYASPPYVVLSEVVKKGGTPVNGGGTLANVTFSVAGNGNCTLELFRVKLIDGDRNPIPPNTGPPDYYFTNLKHGYFYTTCPVASFEMSPDPGTDFWRPIVGETVTFDASGSYDPDDPYDSTPGGITSYYWDFGDGGTAAENDPITTHAYTASGTFDVTLKVTDDENENGTHTYPQFSIKRHDIALINVTAYPAEVAAGATVTINVTVLNEGSAMEYLNVTVYYDYNPIEERVFSYTIDSTVRVTLSPGKNGTCTIPWKTTGIAPGTYMIGAKVELIQDSGLYRGVSLDEWEADKTDNAMFAGPITIWGHAHIDIDPDTLNLKSEGQWITCYIELPEGYNVGDIDISTIMLDDTIPVSLLDVPAPKPVPIEIGDYDNDGIPDLMVKFDRAAVASYIYHDEGISYGDVVLTITGSLFDGTPFEGSDTIWVNYAGDVNGDGNVDGFDLTRMAAAYGSTPGDSEWDEPCDINLDEIVDGYDLIPVAANYGATVP